MTQMDVEEEIFLDSFEEFEVPCDGPRIWGDRKPDRLGWEHGAAKWILLKSCGHHRLICDMCRNHFLACIARGDALSCWLNEEDAHPTKILSIDAMGKA